MEYKGYTAKITFDGEVKILHGQIAGILDVVTFQGKTAEEFVQAFHDSVDEYLKICEEDGAEPEKPFSGNFMVRADPELHRQITVAALARGLPTNQWVIATLRQQLAAETGTAIPVQSVTAVKKAPLRKQGVRVQKQVRSRAFQKAP